MPSYADFTGGCGEDQSAGAPAGLQLTQHVRLNGSPGLNACMIGFNNASIFAIQLLSATDPSYRYALTVDGKGPDESFAGGFHLAFTDQAGETYHLELRLPKRRMHTVSYNSDRPAIVRIQWSNRPIGAAPGRK